MFQRIVKHYGHADKACFQTSLVRRAIAAVVARVHYSRLNPTAGGGGQRDDVRQVEACAAKALFAMLMDARKREALYQLFDPCEVIRTSSVDTAHRISSSVRIAARDDKECAMASAMIAFVTSPHFIRPPNNSDLFVRVVNTLSAAVLMPHLWTSTDTIRALSDADKTCNMRMRAVSELVALCDTPAAVQLLMHNDMVRGIVAHLSSSDDFTTVYPRAQTRISGYLITLLRHIYDKGDNTYTREYILRHTVDSALENIHNERYRLGSVVLLAHLRPKGLAGDMIVSQLRAVESLRSLISTLGRHDYAANTGLVCLLADLCADTSMHSALIDAGLVQSLVHLIASSTTVARPIFANAVAIVEQALAVRIPLSYAPPPLASRFTIWR